jgi:hypothetical protein
VVTAQDACAAQSAKEKDARNEGGNSYRSR